MNRLFTMLDDSNQCATSPNAQMQGVVFDLKRYAIHDGPGIRTTVFLKGCPLRCSWCHNPESWREGIESNLRERNNNKSLACGRENKSSQTVGRLVSPNQLMKDLERDVLFYDESGGGVTFSGGEPLMQIDFLEAMLHRCRDHEIHTAIDTTCHGDWSILKRIMPLVNLFLCDLKLMDSAAHEQYTGVSNKQILDNLQRLNQADDLTEWSFNVYYELLDGRPNTKGGKYRVNLLPTTCHIYFGQVLNATPDGRRAFTPVSEGISPSQGCDVQGPTAVIKSAARIDHARTGGTLLNMKFTPQILDDDAGINAMGQLIRTYFRMDGHHIQFNVVTVDQLRQAQQEPEKHRNLIVRVAGYSDYFVDIGIDLQNEIIARTEHASL